MTRPLRIAVARIAQETNAGSAVHSTVDDFRRIHFLEGAEVLRACRPLRSEAPGFLRNAELSGFLQAVRASRAEVEVIPLFSAWAIPGGPLTAESLAWFRGRLRADLAAAGPLDGVFLSMHGALSAVGCTDPEGVLLQDAREVVGPARIAVTFDLHGHLTSRKVDAVDVLAAYQTNPHRDHARTGRRAGGALLGTLRGTARPTTAWRSLPMVLGGGTTLDFLRPMRGIFRRIRHLEHDPRVLTASLFTAHLWHDAPDLGWAAHVTTDGDPELAERLADELADALWAVRHEGPPRLPEPREALAEVRAARLARRLGTVCVSDASDMVGAGAPGDSTHLLRILLQEATDLRSYAPVRDPEVVAQLFSEAPGAWVSVEVGGRLDPTSGPPVRLVGTLRSRSADAGFGRAVVVDAGHVQVVITEGPPLAMKPSFYRQHGLRPVDADLCVVKSLFPFRLYFALQNRKTIYVRTRGTTDFDAPLHRTYDGPVHPRDPVPTWREADHRRRAGGVPYQRPGTRR